MRKLSSVIVLSLAIAGCSSGSADERRAGGTPADAAVPTTDTTRPVDSTPPAESSRSEGKHPIAARLDRGPEYREVTIPAGTVLPVELKSAVASDTSRPEDAVRGTLRRAVVVDGVRALPAGSTLRGHVTSAKRSARVKGRASVAFRFNRIEVPGGDRLAISTRPISRVAPATRKADAAKIGGGAAGGAIIGGLLGGGDGAAKGAAVGGAAGTGVVLSTRGKEIRLGPGAALSVRLTAPLIVRVPIGD